MTMTATDTIPAGRPMVLSTLDVDTARARRTDPITSHEAADHNDVEHSIGLVLADLREFGPAADHELVARLSDSPFTPQRIRTARAALVKRRVVEKAGYFHLTRYNRRAFVWQVVA